MSNIFRCLHFVGVILPTLASSQVLGQEVDDSRVRQLPVAFNLASAMQEEEHAAESDTHPEEAGDPMEDIQSFNTYISLEDGQPGQRGEFQINFSNGWETQSGESDPWLMEIEVEYSPDVPDSWLLRNSKFGLSMPFELANGRNDSNGDVYVAWKQRLIEEQPPDWWPTVTVENELRLPSGDGSSGVDWTLQGVVAKELGPGTAVFNAFLTSANGNNNIESASWWDQLNGEEDESLRHLQWGLRVGYKWRITDEFALVAGYTLQSSELKHEDNQNIGEVAAEWRVNDNLTIGPGIMFGLDGREDTPNFGAGVLVHYSWE